MNSKFLVFGGSVSKIAAISQVSGVGLLISYTGHSLFIFSPFYEVNRGDFLTIETGIGISIFPNISYTNELCRSLLNSGKVDLDVESQPLETLLEMDSAFVHSDSEFVRALELKIPILDLRIPIVGGEVRITRGKPGTLSIEIDMDAFRVSPD